MLADDLNQAIACADIIVSATAANRPLITLQHVRPGTHGDLVGSYRPDIREADSDLIAAALVYTDNIEAALATGDLVSPIASGVFARNQIRADLFTVCQQPPTPRSADTITAFKNAGARIWT